MSVFIDRGDIIMLNIAPSTQDRVSNLVGEILSRRSIDKAVLPGHDLRESGLTSLDMVNLMLAVEAEFDVRIPENQMTPQNFRSISTIDALVATLVQAG